MHTENYYITRIEELSKLTAKYNIIQQFHRSEVVKYVRSYLAKNNKHKSDTQVLYDLKKYVDGELERSKFFSKHKFLSNNTTAYVTVRQYKSTYQLYVRKLKLLKDLKKEYSKYYPQQTKYKTTEIEELPPGLLGENDD